MRTTGPGLIWDNVPNTNILVACHLGPTTLEQERRYLDYIRSLSDIPQMRFVIYIDGPATTPRFNRRIGQLVRGQEGWQAALMSPSLALRFVVTAVALVNRRIRFFTPEQQADMIEYFRCTVEEADALIRLLEALRSRA